MSPTDQRETNKPQRHRKINISLKHEQNRGLSAGRNTGSTAATGNYIYLLDRDD